jgi:transposase
VRDINSLPNDVPSLKRLVIECDREIEHLKLQLAKLRRWKFGQSSEQLEGLGQMVLRLQELQAVAADAVRESAATSNAAGAAQPSPDGEEASAKPKTPPVRRKQLPEHFERIENIIQPQECVCPDCGGALQDLGKPDVAEVAEVKTITFTVTKHVRPKKRCCQCPRIVQAPAPSRPIEKSFAGATLLALTLVWKYAFHIPLYRQCQIFAHTGLKISRTTLMQWVAATSVLLGPLVEALAKYVLSASNVNGDDTPVKVMAPGRGKTKTGYLWTYVRDGRRWGARDPPAVWYQYSPTREGVHPQRHLKNYAGTLQVDGYSGFDALFVPPKPNVPARIIEVGCWAHVRRGLFDLYVATRSPTAKEALERIGQLYKIEEQIRGQSPEKRLKARQERAVPLLNALHTWMVQVRTEVENASALAKALDYALKETRWLALLRYTQDGRLEIDNNSAERSIRGAAVGKKNYLFFGSDSGGERAAIAYSLVETCKLNSVDPQLYLQYVIERIADHPINRIEELLPWNVADKLNQPEQVKQALVA